MRAVINYFREVKIELSKVVWPRWQEVVKLTIIVILISAIVGIYVGAVDFGFTKLVGLVISH